MRKWKKLSVFAGAISAISVCTLYWLNVYGLQPWKIVRASVMVDGADSDLIIGKSDSGVYAVIWPKTGDSYAVIPAKDFVGHPNRDVFRVAFGRVWPKPESAALGVRVAAWDPKTESDPQLVVNENSISFTTLDNHRIEIRHIVTRR